VTSRQERFKANGEHLEGFLAFVEEAAQEAFGDHERKTDFMVAAEEAFMNVAMHAYADGGEVEVLAETNGGELALTLIDEGAPFDPASLPPPDLDASLEDRAIGSLGVHLIYSLVDEVRYRREGGRNLLTLVTRIDALEQTERTSTER